jgi:hypothetical protein
MVVATPRPALRLGVQLTTSLAMPDLKKEISAIFGTIGFKFIDSIK